MLFTRLRSFHAVAAERGFTAASKALSIGQPTITSQVRALEDYFGVELFLRRGRKVAPTEIGQALFGITQRMMRLEAEAADLLNAAGGLQIGKLHVGAVGPYHVTEMLAAFNARYPDITISVTLGNSKEMLARLVDFHADVAVLAHVEDDPRFFAVPYSRHPVVVFVNERHEWAERAEIGIAELEGRQFVLREVGSTTRLAFEAALREAGVSIVPVMEIGSREAVSLAVQRGIGIGVVSEIEFIPHPGLRTIRVRDAGIYTYAHVVCLAERRDSRLIRAFLDVVQTLLQDDDRPGAGG